jgi:hypothetical protein
MSSMRDFGLALLFILCLMSGSVVAGGLEWQPVAEGRFTRLTLPAAGKTGFTAISSLQTGLRFTNALDDRLVTENNNFMEGAGVALGDFDGDGW